jgi:hypothetical protein
VVARPHDRLFDRTADPTVVNVGGVQRSSGFALGGRCGTMRRDTLSCEARAMKNLVLGPIVAVLAVSGCGSPPTRVERACLNTPASTIDGMRTFIRADRNNGISLSQELAVLPQACDGAADSAGDVLGRRLTTQERAISVAFCLTCTTAIVDEVYGQ